MIDVVKSGNNSMYELIQIKRRVLNDYLQIFDNDLKGNLGYCIEEKDKKPYSIRHLIKEIHNDVINKLMNLNILEEKVLDCDREQLKRDGLSQIDFERTPGKKIEENEENSESQSGVIVG
ncbi:MAG: hypothetical protein H6622_18185 [Halobacteriovoraceae bacterium]|nr:hypothetical protein [Halobacteriovoraceae bacterium]